MTGDEAVEAAAQEGFALDEHQVKALKFVLDTREQELLEIKGPCSNKHCSLHFAHRGPCDESGWRQ